MANPRIGDLVSPRYMVTSVASGRQRDFPMWGTVVAEKGLYVDVMWSNGKVEEFWTDQDLIIHVENSEENVAQGCPPGPE